MTKAYVVAVYNKIIDPEKLKNYIQDSRPVMGALGAKALAIGSNISNISKLEGIPPERAVIMEFESVEAAQKAFQITRQMRKNSKEELIELCLF